MGMGVRSAMGWEWDGNGNEVIEMGGNWYEKSFRTPLVWSS